MNKLDVRLRATRKSMDQIFPHFKHRQYTWYFSESLDEMPRKLGLLIDVLYIMIDVEGFV